MLLTRILKKYTLSGRCYQCLIQTHGVKTMRAWQAFEYGGPENFQLNTMAVTPAITSPMDILVKVHAASMNPLDVRMLEGYGATAFNTVKKITKCSLAPPEFPLTPGRDFSGTVVYVGKKVKSLKSGDEVWGALSPWEAGTHAEYVLANACHVSKKPNSLTHVEASSFPYAALTAWAGISTFGGLSENSSYGKKVLVTGASGGVGTFAVQLLKAWGADVTVTCSTDAVEMLQNLGADNILDYQSEDFRTNLLAFRE
ncbi:reticulon-4-interacting protein 1, mitochondrial-like [Stegodyphus dumicola]|uniref:reticulon-4-interacting protein 1, mitochondrial-like n=1 Tax=Stegodyphus dumicola TaxID=202533 RepID=UPI0015AB90D2|nr:reticulon-4-interacting protein 1, mitochondrial-like [Stegodyphus dumicola]